MVHVVLLEEQVYTSPVYVIPDVGSTSYGAAPSGVILKIPSSPRTMTLIDSKIYKLITSMS